VVANETILLVFTVALVWRYRDRPWIAALLTATAISLKPFIWPLVLWLLATRRWRASLYTVLCGVVLNVVAWSIVGFNQIHAYLHAADIDVQISWRTGYNLVALAAHLGLGRSVGEALMVVVSAALAVAIVYVAFIKHRELEALTLTIALMLTASALVWNHYFALLLIPMALARPRFSWLWVLPLLMWFCPDYQTHGWQEAVGWIVAGTLLFTATRRASV